MMNRIFHPEAGDILIRYTECKNAGWTRVDGCVGRSFWWHIHQNGEILPTDDDIFIIQQGIET